MNVIGWKKVLTPSLSHARPAPRCPAEAEELARTFEAVEAKLGPGVHERYETLLAELEAMSALG